MNVTDADFEIHDNGPNMPQHQKDWGWRESDWERFQATWTLAATRRLSAEGSEVRGCPLGTGKTIESAKANLISRTNAESKTALQLGAS